MVGNTMKILANSFYIVFSLFLLVMAFVSPNLTTSVSFLVLLASTLTFIYVTRASSNDGFVIGAGSES